MFLIFAVGKVQADAAACDEHAADQGDDQCRVLGEQTPAQGHRPLRARTLVENPESVRSPRAMVRVSSTPRPAVQRFA